MLLPKSDFEYQSYIQPAPVEEVVYEEMTIEPPPPEIPKCEHVFRNLDKVITEYSPEIDEWVINHGRFGYYIEGFCGEYNVSVDEMMKWLSSPVGEYEEFKTAVKISISASLAYWNQELMHAIKERDFQVINIIKSILADIMRSTPKELRNMQFNNLINKTPEEIAAEEKQKAEENLQKAFRGKTINE